MIIRPYLASIGLKLKTFASQSTFAGGLMELRLDNEENDDIKKVWDDVTGEYIGIALFDIEMPPWETMYCFSVSLYPGTSPIEWGAEKPVACPGVNGGPKLYQVKKAFVCKSAYGECKQSFRFVKYEKTGCSGHYPVVVGAGGSEVLSYIKTGTDPDDPDPYGCGKVDCSEDEATWEFYFDNVAQQEPPISVYDVKIGDTTFDDKVVVFDVTSVAGVGMPNDHVYCTHSSCFKTVTAVLTGVATLPEGFSINWGGSASFTDKSGLTAKAWFAGNAGEDRKVTASIGTQAVESDPFVVVAHIPVTEVQEVTYTYVAASFPAATTWGIVEHHAPENDITAYFDHQSHSWKVKVTAATDDIGIAWRLLPGPPQVQEASAAAATEDNWAQMIVDLFAYNGVGISANNWFILDAVKAHEQVHADKFIEGNNAAFDTFRGAVAALSCPYGGQFSEAKTAAEAKEAIKNIYTGYTLAEANYSYDSLALLCVGGAAVHPQVNDAVQTAMAAVVTPVVTAIQAKVEENGWNQD